jgi:hypothetical protein
VVRSELRPRLFLSTSEFLWQEGHTAHAPYEEARAFAARIHQDVYAAFMADVLAIDVLPGLLPPVQVVVLAIKGEDAALAAARESAERLAAAGVRGQVDDRTDVPCGARWPRTVRCRGRTIPPVTSP